MQKVCQFCNLPLKFCIFSPPFRLCRFKFMMRDAFFGMLNISLGGIDPFLCANTAIPLLLDRALAAGADKLRLRVHIIGGAQVSDGNGLFQIGIRNCLAARRILSKARVPIQGQQTGGSVARSVRLDAGTGEVRVREGVISHCEKFAS